MRGIVGTTPPPSWEPLPLSGSVSGEPSLASLVPVPPSVVASPVPLLVPPSKTLSVVDPQAGARNAAARAIAEARGNARRFIVPP
jgi:hypothetical protein